MGFVGRSNSSHNIDNKQFVNVYICNYIKDMPSQPKRSRRTQNRLKKKRERIDATLYHAMDWRYYSREFRKNNPTCAICKARTNCVDHTIPVRIGGSFWDVRNHQSLCNKCHGRKSSNESRDVYEAHRKNFEGELIPLRGGLFKSK